VNEESDQQDIKQSFWCSGLFEKSAYKEYFTNPIYDIEPEWI